GDGQLPQADPGAQDEADRVGQDPDVPFRGPRAEPVRFGQPGDQRGEADAHHHEDDQRPDGGAHRTDLGPLGPHQASEARGAAGGGVRGAAGRGERRGGRHEVLPWAASVLAAPNSTLPDLSSMHPPYSEASPVSSCSPIDAEAASSPTRGASRPVTVSSPAPSAGAPRTTLPPAAV